MSQVKAPFLKETVSPDLPDSNMQTHLPSGSQRRVSSSYSMFWVTDTERVIRDQHNQPCSLTMDKWKERKEEVESLNDRGWAHQGMSAYAGKNRTSVLNRYWQRHISDKNGICMICRLMLKGPMAGNCTQRSKATFTYALTLMDKVGGWSDEKMDWTEICCVCEDIPKQCVTKSVVVNRLWTWILHKQ